MIAEAGRRSAAALAVGKHGEATGKPQVQAQAQAGTVESDLVDLCRNRADGSRLHQLKIFGPEAERKVTGKGATGLDRRRVRPDALICS